MLIAFVVSACGSIAPVAPTPPMDAVLDVDNDTDIEVAMTVNDMPIGRVEAHATAAIPTTGFGPKPWDMLALSPRGRGIVALNVGAGDFHVPDTSDTPDTPPDDVGAGIAVVMTCGELAFGFGNFPKVPSAGDPPIPCDR